ncbi:MAG: hypothetical protein AB8B54_13450 [Sphingorhabdus sp.]
MGIETKGTIEPPKIDFFDLGQVIKKENIGSGWSKVFTRNSEEWSMNNNFDLSPILMPNEEKPTQT